MPGPGVDDHAGGLVHDDEIIIYQQEFQGQIFRRSLQRRPWQDRHGNDFPGGDSMRGFGCASIDAHIPLTDQFLNPRAAQQGNVLREEQVEPAPGVAGSRNECLPCHRG